VSTNDDIARRVLHAGVYVVLATADAAGVPWASPVWFATETPSTFFWVSYPGARHSENIQVQPRIAMVVFDSTVPPLTGQAVYMTANAEQVTDPPEVAHAVDVFSLESQRQGLSALSLEEVTGSARLRMYRARVEDYWILDPDIPHDKRVQVRPYGQGDST
jgi:hypothetical protein